LVGLAYKVKNLDIVGMEGNKNDRPKWINTIFRQTVYDILANNNPTVNLKKQFQIWKLVM
jgi:hypothetical protein